MGIETRRVEVGRDTVKIHIARDIGGERYLWSATWPGHATACPEAPHPPRSRLGHAPSWGEAETAAQGSLVLGEPMMART